MPNFNTPEALESALALLPADVQKAKRQELISLGMLPAPKNGMLAEGYQGLMGGLVQAYRGIGGTLLEGGIPGGAGLDLDARRLQDRTHQYDPYEGYSATQSFTSLPALARTAGQAVGSTVPGLIGGIAGAAVGGPVGGWLGGFGTIFGQQYGDTLEEYRQKLPNMPEEDRKTRAFAYSLFNAAVEQGFGPQALVAKGMKNLAKRTAEEATEKLIKTGSWNAVKDLAKSGIKGMLESAYEEGGEEAVQLAGNHLILAMSGAAPKDLPGIREYIENTVGGIVGGAFLGAPAGVFEGATERIAGTRRAQYLKDRAAGQAVLDQGAQQQPPPGPPDGGAPSIGPQVPGMKADEEPAPTGPSIGQQVPGLAQTPAPEPPPMDRPSPDQQAELDAAAEATEDDHPLSPMNDAKNIVAIELANAGVPLAPSPWAAPEAQQQAPVVEPTSVQGEAVEPAAEAATPAPESRREKAVKKRKAAATPAPAPAATPTQESPNVEAQAEAAPVEQASQRLQGQVAPAAEPAAVEPSAPAPAATPQPREVDGVAIPADLDPVQFADGFNAAKSGLGTAAMPQDIGAALPKRSWMAGHRAAQAPDNVTATSSRREVSADEVFGPVQPVPQWYRDLSLDKRVQASSTSDEVQGEKGLYVRHPQTGERVLVDRFKGDGRQASVRRSNLARRGEVKKSAEATPAADVAPAPSGKRAESGEALRDSDVPASAEEDKKRRFSPDSVARGIGEHLGQTSATDRVPPSPAEVKPAAAAPTATPAGAAAQSAPAVNPDADLDAEFADLARQMREQLNRLGSGVDPTIAVIGTKMAYNRVQKGARTFARFAADMRVAMPGEWEKLKNYLHGFWTLNRQHPDFAHFKKAIESLTDDAAELIIGATGPAPAVAKPSSPVSIKDERAPAQEAPHAATDTSAQPGVRSGDAEGERAPGVGRRGDVPPVDGGTPHEGDVGDGVPADAGGAGTGQHPVGVPERADQPGVQGSREGEGQRAPGVRGSGGPVQPGNGAVEPGHGGGVAGGPQPAVSPGRENYRIADPVRLYGGGPKARFNRNRTALETYERILFEQRDPTPAELDAMASWTGWGSLGQELFQGSWDRPTFAKNWETENRWLRDHLGEQGWKSAQESIVNAHYTDPPTVVAMWNMLFRMGFTGGRVLEPGFGIGNFYGLMPSQMMANSQLTAIELEQATGRMAQILYPQANVQVKGYEESQTADNFYDLVVGNWPFAQQAPADRRYNKYHLTLHDYYFVKALDQTRPGGIVMGLTSAWSMDRRGAIGRRQMARRGELIAAFRMPTGAFKEYAGTDVVADILIFRKRAEMKQDVSDEPWVDGIVDAADGSDYYHNSYWTAHPDHILGRMEYGQKTTTGRPGMTVTRLDDFEQRLAELPGFLPADAFRPWTAPTGGVSYISNTAGVKRQNSVVFQDGDLYRVEGEQLALVHDIEKWKVADARKTAKRLAEAQAIIDIRDSFDALMVAYRQPGGDVDQPRRALRKQYDAFVKAYGPLSESWMLQLMRNVGDPSARTLQNMEELKGGKWVPRAILTRDIMRRQEPDTAGNIDDAYAVHRNHALTLDLDAIAKAAGKSREEVVARLVELNQIFQTPAGQWEHRDQYLEGNVRRKLREARDAAAQGTDMARNIAVLETIQPKDTPYFDIEVSMGAAWIPVSDYVSFFAHLMNVDPTGKATDAFEIQRQATGWNVKVTDPTVAHSAQATTQWGTGRIGIAKLFTAAMNGTPVTVMAYDPSTKSEHVDKEATEQANGKVEEIREELVSWLWKDPERNARLTADYNETMNSMVTPKRDGSYLRLEGLALTIGQGEFDFRKHQKDGVARGLQDGSAMFFHEVGTGKTFTMAGLAVELRRLGRYRKPLIFAHNANSMAVHGDFERAYPGGRFLYIDNLSKAKKEATLRQIQLDDWDAVIVPHSLLDNFQLKTETLRAMAAQDIRELEDQLAAEVADLGVSLDGVDLNDMQEVSRRLGRTKGAHTAKDLVKRRNAILNNILKMAAKQREDGVFFEDLGVDCIMVDEAHLFKKTGANTRKNIKGLDKETSDRAWMLKALTKYVKGQNNGKGVYLFTGTPLTNNVNEAFGMMHYVMDDVMEELTISRFDDWFNTFAQADFDIELTSGGTFAPVERLKSFINVPELARIAARYFDVVRAADMPEFTPRESREGYAENPQGVPYKEIVPVIGEMSPAQHAHKKDVERRFNQYQALTGKEKRERQLTGGDIPLKMEHEGVESSLDYRMLEHDQPDHERSKVSMLVQNLMRVYRDDAQSAQMVFMERGFNDWTTQSRVVRDHVGRAVLDADGKSVKDKTRTRKFNLLRDIVERLEREGVDPSEVAVFSNMTLDRIDERPNDILRLVNRVTGAVSKDALATMMREGKVRFAFGSSETMGTGVNAQDWLRAGHHLDAPWTPGALEQRNGRFVRQGNKWNTVYEFRYFTEGSHDGKRWQTLLNKVKFISQFSAMLRDAEGAKRVLSGEGADLGETDTGSSVADFEQSFSAAAGDPRLLLRAKLGKDVARLERRKNNHLQSQHDAELRIAADRQYLESEELALRKVREDLAQSRAAAEDAFSIEIDGKTYTKRSDADEAFEALPMQVLDAAVARFRGFTLFYESGWNLADYGNRFRLMGPSRHRYAVHATLGSIEAVIRQLAKYEGDQVTRIDKLRSGIAALEAQRGVPFGREADLAAKQKALDQVNLELSVSPAPAPAWLRHGIPAGSLVYIEGKPEEVAAHRWDENGYWLLVESPEGLRPVSYLKAMDENGNRILREVPFVTPSGEKKSATVSPMQAAEAFSNIERDAREAQGPLRARIVRAIADAEKRRDAASAWLDDWDRRYYINTPISNSTRIGKQKATKTQENERDRKYDEWEVAGRRVKALNKRLAVVEGSRYTATMAGKDFPAGRTPTKRGTFYRLAPEGQAEAKPTSTMADARALWRRMFGSDADLRDVSRLLTKGNIEALGQWTGRWAELVSGQADPSDTAMHEAVHKALDLFLSAEDRARLVQAAGGEEVLAEKIIAYARDGKGFVGRAKRIVERLLRVLRRYFGTPAAQDKVRDFYDRLLGGGFAVQEARGLAGEPAAAYRQIGGEVHQKYGDTDAERLQKRERLQGMAPVKADTSAFGSEMNAKALRVIGYDEYQKLFGTKIVNQDDGKTITFRGVQFGKPESHSADPRIMRLIPSLPKLLGTAVYLYSKPEVNKVKYRNILAWHTYAAKVTLDGQPLYVALTTFEEKDGNEFISLYHDHNVAAVEVMEKGVAAKPDPVTNRAVLQDALLKNNLYQWWHSVKSDEPDTRYRTDAAAQDAEYLAAVERGDMTTAQKMVDEAARKARYTVAAAHGTDVDAAFTVFKQRPSDIGIHFGSEGQAQDRTDYLRSREGRTAGPRPRLLRVLLHLRWPIRLKDAGAWNLDNLESQLKDLFPQESAAIGKLRTPKDIREFLLYHGYDGVVYLNEGEVAGAQRLQAVQDDALKKLKESQKRRGKSLSGFDLEDQKTPEYVAYRKAYRDTLDYRQKNAADSYIVFARNQVKSADPVTRDDAGRVIPLSERFNEASPDIRYRTAAQAAETAADANATRTLAEHWNSGLDWVHDFLTMRKVGEVNARPDISKADVMLRTIAHYAKKVPALARILKAAMDFAMNRHLYGERIFGAGEMLVADLVDFRKKNPEAYRTRVAPYILEQDRNAVGPRVTKEGDGWAVYSASKQRLGTAKTESEAWAAAHLSEVQELLANGWTAAEAEAVYTYRTIADNTWGVLAEDIRKIIAEREAEGLPTSIVTADGTAIDLHVALAEIGDRRGYYMPRLRKNGPHQLIATKDSANPISKYFDTAIARDVAATNLQREGYEIEKKHSTRPSEEAYLDASVAAVEDLVNNALREMGSDVDTMDFAKVGLQATYEQYHRKTDGKDERHLVIRGPFSQRNNEVFKDFGGYPEKEDGSWHFPGGDADVKRDMLRALLHVKYSQMMPSEAVAKAMAESLATVLHSRGSQARKIGRSDATGVDVWEGYEEDPLKAITMAGKSTASGAAKRQMVGEMMRAFTGRDESWQQFKERRLAEGVEEAGDSETGSLNARLWREYDAQVKERRIDSALQSNAYKDGIDYMREMARNEEPSERLLGIVKGLAALKYLSGVAPAAVNMTALVTTVPAVLHGFGHIPLARIPRLLSRGIGTYSRFYMQRKFGKGEVLTGDDAWLMNEISRRGYDEQAMNREAIGVMQTWGQAQLAWITEKALLPFGVTEKINRGSTVAAAYWGLVEKHGGELTASDRIRLLDEAKALSDQAHGTYGKVNLPSWARGSSAAAQIARSFYMYKTFSHNFLQILAELGIEKREGAAVMILMLAPALLGGVGAIAGKDLLKKILTAMLEAVPGYDPPDDIEEAVYAAADRTFGQVGERTARSGLGGLLGVDLRGTLAVNLTDVPTNIGDLLGAPWSVMKDVGGGVAAMAHGDVMKGAEKLAPRFIAGPLKAIRESTEGVTTPSNQPVYYGNEKLRASAVEAAIRAAGFSPSRLATIREKQWKERQTARDYDQNRSDIYRRVRAYYNQSAYARDPGDWADILGLIEGYNARVKRNGSPSPFITAEVLRRIATQVGRAPKREMQRAAAGDEEREEPLLPTVPPEPSPAGESRRERYRRERTARTGRRERTAEGV